MKLLVFILIGIQLLSVCAFGYLIRENGKAVTALCSIRADREQDVARTEEYLKEHPRGVVSPKTNAVIISATLLRQGLERDRQAVKNLSGLGCPS